MTANKKGKRCGVTPVMSQAGVVPGPMPRMGPPQATSGHLHQRFTQIKQRKRNLEQKTRHKKPFRQKKDRAEKERQSSINILQINIAGISKKKTEIAHLLSEKEVHVALVQESQHQNTDPYISGYTHTICNHNKENCQGILTYIRNDLTATVELIETDRPTSHRHTQNHNVVQ